MKATRLPQRCGCVTMGPRYVSMCPTHQAEFDETHKRWAIERAAGNFSGQFIHTLEKKDEPRNPA
jgi:hypothetical protein